jgi:hypothetical protein
VHPHVFVHNIERINLNVFSPRASITPLASAAARSKIWETVFVKAAQFQIWRDLFSIH